MASNIYIHLIYQVSTLIKQPAQQHLPKTTTAFNRRRIHPPDPIPSFPTQPVSMITRTLFLTISLVSTPSINNTHPPRPLSHRLNSDILR